MARQSPWTLVPAADYEGHMGPECADQLAPLSAIFASAYRALRPERLLVLGVATGNGLEHVDPAITARTVGLDVNIQYLAVARQRHMRLGPGLELFCSDVERAQQPAESFDLVWAALLFEHVDLRVVAPRVAGWLAPGGSLVAVLQLPGGPMVAPSPYPSVQALAAAMRLVPPDELADRFEEAGLEPRQRYVVPVAHGRQLFAARWRKPE